MIKYFLVLFTLLSFQSLAHVKMGIYQGQTENNEKCEVEIKEKWYTENFKHPLNERVEVYFELAKTHFTLVHPPTYMGHGRVKSQLSPLSSNLCLIP